MKAKLEILMADTGLRVGEIAAKLGVKAPVISHILSGRNQPNFALTAKIVSTFNQYNPYWWLGCSDVKLAIDNSTPSIKEEPQNFSAAESPTAEPKVESELSPIFGASTSIPTFDHSIQSRPSSEIERVIVIYRDKSFESFTPRK